MMSRPILFFGNAITSRIDSVPVNMAQSLSNPKAIPPCGGAPYSNAFIRKPNCALASSFVNQRRSNIFCCNALSCIRIEPPPTSMPLMAMSYAFARMFAGSDSIKLRSAKTGLVKGWCMA